MASGNLEMLKKTGNNKFSDEVYTPQEAVEPLLEFLPKEKVYYEATSNKSSSIVDYMREQGYNIISSEGRDFLKDPLPDFDIMITNPPYSIKDKFIARCYEINKPFALLLPVSSIQGITRGCMFNEFGIDLLVLNKRIDFTGGGSPHFGVA